MRCEVCGKEMNIVDWMISKVCLECTNKNHNKVIKQ